MQAWKEEVCAHKPEELQMIAPDKYIQRKDIMQVHHEATEDQEARDDFKCMSREISVSEYEMLRSIEQIETDQAIDAYTLQLMEEGLI